MGARLAADAIVVLHFAFLLFVVAGGLLVLRRVAVAWLHVPAVLWAAWIELTGGICPLTPWENALRADAGEAGYRGGFVEHYVIPLVYPPGLTPEIQRWLGVALAAGTAVLYAIAWHRHRRRPRR